MTTTIHDDLGDVHIVTNNVPRPIINVHYERDEGWVKAIDPGDDYQTSPGFEYRGEVYALQEFSITRGLPETSPFKRFDAFQPSSAFSGIGFSWASDESDTTDNWQRVIVAYVHW